MNRWIFSILLFTLPVHIAADSTVPITPDNSNRKLETKFENIFSTFLRRRLTIEKVTKHIFPLRYTGTNIKLWEDAKLVMAEGPSGTFTVSTLKTLLTARLQVKEMRFKNSTGYLRFDHDGNINVVQMVKDLGDYARKNYHGERQKVVYNIFRVENARVHVIDRDLNVEPLGAPLKVDARGDIHGLGPDTKFPFHLNGRLMSGKNPMQLNLSGTISNWPQIHVLSQNVPLSAVVPYLPVLRWFEGSANADASFAKSGAYTFWKLKFLVSAVKSHMPLPFPTIKADGFFHAYMPSHVNITLAGKPTRVNVSIGIQDFKTKRASLVVESKKADIDECIQWCRTGYWLNAAPVNTMNLPPQSRWPHVWKISGTATIDAELNSVMGPALVQDANGHVKIRVDNGRLSGMPGLIKTFALLNLSSMLGDPNKPPNGLQFATVNADVTMKNGVATTNYPILLESPTINLGLIGQIDFSKQTIDAKMIIGVASVSEAVIAHIPLVRRFKTGEKKGVVPIWLSIQGSLDSPQIKILPIRTFGRDLWKMLPEAFQVPERVLKEIYEKDK